MLTKYKPRDKSDPLQEEFDRRVNKAYYILSRVCRGGVIDPLLPPNEIDDILDSIDGVHF